MDLRTKYMGLALKNPVVPSSGPFSETLEGIKRMEDAGAAAVVLFSLFEEQIRHEEEALNHLTTAGTESFAESLSYFPEMEEYRVGPERYLELIRSAVDSTDIPIIGSLNGVSSSGWTDYARQFEQAGASAIELNIYHIATNPDMSCADVEQMYIDVVKAVKSTVSIPVALKLSPFFSAMGNAARRFVDAGAQALVLFNRFYQPDIDLQEMEVASNLALSTPSEMRLPLRWIAILKGRIGASLAATTGVHTSDEVVKYLLAGADVTMTTSALLKNGIAHIQTLIDGLSEWMEQNEYDSVDQLRGAMSQQAVGDPGAFERANYIKILESYKGQYMLS